MFAARILEDELPGLYAQALQAIISGEPLPWLGEYNRLVTLPGLAKGLEGSDRERVIDLVMSKVRMTDVEWCVEQEFPAVKRAALAASNRIEAELNESAGADLINLVNGVYAGWMDNADVADLLRRQKDLLDERAKLASRLLEELGAAGDIDATVGDRA